jgi:hypothetical protein
LNRKDFELVAKVVKAFPLVGKERLAKSFADMFAAGDGCSGFDRAKFLQRCGVPDVQR